MTTSVVKSRELHSPMPDMMQEVTSATLSKNGASLKYLLSGGISPNIVSEANKKGYKAFICGIGITIKQSKSLAGIVGDSAFFQPRAARLAKWNVALTIPGVSDYLNQQTDELVSLGLVDAMGRSKINPALAKRADNLIAAHLNGVPKRVPGAVVGDAVGGGDTYGSFSLGNGQDQFESFGFQTDGLEQVSSPAAIAVPTSNLGASNVDHVFLPLCTFDGEIGRSGESDEAIGLPLDVATNTSAAWSLEVTRGDFTELYSAGTVFGDATVRVFLYVRFYRIAGGNDAQRIGKMWYLHTNSSNFAPFQIPVAWRMLEIFLPPKFRSLTQYDPGSGGTIACGIECSNYYNDFAGTSPKLRWKEHQNGSDYIVFPLLPQDEHPEHVVMDMYNFGGADWQRAETRYSKTPLRLPDVKRGAQPWTAATSTRIHPSIAGCVTPTNLGLAGTALGVVGSVVSGLWCLPLAVEHPGLKGFVGGPQNCGDIRPFPPIVEVEAMPTLAAIPQSYVLRESGIVDDSAPGGFINNAAVLTKAYSGGGGPNGPSVQPTPANPDSSNAPMAIATGFVPGVIAGTGKQAK